jgi:hypothetical protein
VTSCTFAEFFAACKDRLTDAQLRTLDPRAQYFKIKDGYCGLLIEAERTWVSIMVGGVRDVWHLRKVLCTAGMPLVGFKCRPDSPTHKLAIYYGAKIEDSGEKYPDGVDCLRCLIYTKQTKRVKNIKAQSQALT